MPPCKSIFALLLLFLSIQSYGQENISPNKKFLWITLASEAGEHTTKWTRYLVNKQSSDTILVAIDSTSDAPPPVSYWNKSSSKLIYDFEKDDNGKIKIYDLNLKKEIYSASGDIWYNAQNHFDSERNLLFFFRAVPNSNTFQFLSLDIENLREKVITKIDVWKDHLELPSIKESDFTKKELTIEYSLPDFSGSKKIQLKY